MKRFLSIFLCLMLLVAAIFTVTACGSKDEGSGEQTECTEHEYTSAVTTEATCGKEGVKTYTCTKCQATKTETIPPTGQHTVVPDDAIPAKCGVAGKTAGSHCSVCEEILVAQNDVPALEHSYEDQRCTNCRGFHPDANITTYTFDANDMDIQNWTEDGQEVQVGTDGFLTIITKSGSKIETANNVEYEDGYVATQRLSLGGKVNWTTEKDSDGNVIRWYVSKTGLKFSVTSNAVVRIWWMAGKPTGAANGDATGRYIGIQSVDGVTSSETKNDCVAQTESGYVNVANYDEFDVEAGSYYISNLPTDSPGGTNYIFKIEVIVINE